MSSSVVDVRRVGFRVGTDAELRALHAVEVPVAADGVPVAAGFWWSNSAGDERVVEGELFVLPEWRRRGIATRLLAVICEEARQGRSLLTWSTFDPVPAGEAFVRRVGARVARVNRTSELVLADVDWAMVERWARAERPAINHALGFKVISTRTEWQAEIGDLLNVIASPSLTPASATTSDDSARNAGDEC